MTTTTLTHEINPWWFALAAIGVLLIAAFLSFRSFDECNWIGCHNEGTVLMAHPISGIRYRYCEYHASKKEEQGYIRI